MHPALYPEVVIQEAHGDRGGVCGSESTMVNRSSSLLALIHQHLLKHGYAKAARELEIENGEKFTAQKMSLKKMYKDWNKKGKKKKKRKKGSKVNDSKSKEPRVQDPYSSSESSEDEENDKGAKFLALLKVTDLVAQGKKGKASAKKVSKVKEEPATPKKMNSAKKSASKKVKDATKKGKVSLRDKPVATETLIAEALAKSSGDSDSEEEMVPAAPVQEPPLKSTPAADPKSKKTSSNTKSKAAKLKKTQPAKTAPAAAPTKSLSASNGRDAVNSDVSDSSDETDIEKQPVAVTPSITALSPVKASKKKSETPSTAVQPAADSSESSESESEEQAVKQKVSAPAAPQVKATARSSKTTKATKASAITKATVTPASRGRTAAKKTPAKTAVEESSEDWDSDNELVPSTPPPAPPSSTKASKQMVQIQPTVPAAEEDDSSASSVTDIENEPVRQNLKTTASPKKGAKAASSQASKPVTVVSAGSESSEDSDSSDSEPKALEKTANDLSSSKGRTNVKQPVTTPHSGKARTSQPAPADDSSEMDDSDSDEEPEPKVLTKTVGQLQASAVRTPSKSVTPGKPGTPLKTAAPAADTSESDDSDSDEEPGATKNTSHLLASSGKAPSLKSATSNTPAGKAGNLLKPPVTADDSSETDDSDSDEDQGVKKSASSVPASNVKTGSKHPVTLAANAAVGKTRTLLPADDSSETDDSDSDEPLVKSSSAVKASGPTATTVKPFAASAARVPDSDADSESSDFSDSERKKGQKASASQTKTAPKLASPVGKKVSGKMTTNSKPPLSEDSSETSESEDEIPQPVVGTPKQTKPTTAAKGKLGSSAPLQPDKESSSDSDSEEDSDEPEKSAQTQKTALSSLHKTATTVAALGSAKRKTPASGKVAASKKPLVSSSESSDSSDDEDLPLVQKTNAAAVAKQKASTFVPLLTSTPSIDSPAKGKAGLHANSPKPVKTAQSSESQSSGKEAKQVGTPAATPGKAAVKKETKSASQGNTVARMRVTAKVSSESSESSSSDGEEAKEGTPATAASKTPQGKLANKVVKTLGSSSLATPKTKVTSPTKTPAGLKPTAAESSSESSDSEDDLALKVKNQASAVVTKHGKSLPAAKLKSSSPLKTLVVSKAPTDENSESSSDSEDEEINRPKIASLMSSPKAAAKTDISVSAPGNAAGDTSGSEPEESQSLLKAQPTTKRKRTLEKEEKTTPAKPSKKSKVPTTPGGLLESEEETVLALLEGRSPKKAKNKPSKKTPDVTAPTLQDSKSGKKRRNSSDNGLAEKAKKSKKEKKDKQVEVTEEAPSLTSSKEENKKSEKGKRKKDKKESEKLEQSVTAPESTDSGVGLHSKPKKKKKVKGDQD